MTSETEIILDPETALRVEAAYWSTDGTLLVASDSSFRPDPTGPTDTKAQRAFQARRRQLGLHAARGPAPRIKLRYRLAVAPALGVFSLRTGSWFAQDLARDRMDAEIKAYDGPILATLRIEPVSFVTKNGPMRGQSVSYNKPVLTLKGAAPAAE